MTKEVTDAMRDAAWATGDLAAMMTKSELAAIYLAMRSASSSPTTNGEVSEPRQTHCADPDCTGPKPHVAETAGCKWGNPRAALDDEVGRIIEDLRDLKIAAPVLRFMGIGRRSRLIHEIHELANEAAAALAALSTPTTASAVDDPETAKGGECGTVVNGICLWCYWPEIECACSAPALTNHSDLTEGKK